MFLFPLRMCRLLVQVQGPSFSPNIETAYNSNFDWINPHVSPDDWRLYWVLVPSRIDLPCCGCFVADCVLQYYYDTYYDSIQCCYAKPVGARHARHAKSKRRLKVSVDQSGF